MKTIGKGIWIIGMLFLVMGALGCRQQAVPGEGTAGRAASLTDFSGGLVPENGEIREEFFSPTLSAGENVKRTRAEAFTPAFRVGEVESLLRFEDFGHLLFPEGTGISAGMTLEEIASEKYFPGCQAPSAEEMVLVLNDLKTRAERGERIFLPIYSAEEIEADPDKAKTGLFWFRADGPTWKNKGKERAAAAAGKTAVLSSGAGFAYVSALSESLPEAACLAEAGCHAFALIYRPQKAYADLYRAVCFLHDHAGELGIDMEDYSLWGSDAGGRMAASVGSEGAFRTVGRPDIPKPAAVIYQYAGYTNLSPGDPPAFACVGTADESVDAAVMRARVDGLRAMGIPAELHTFRKLPHGFGTGRGTDAEGWILMALRFWEEQIE